MMPLRRPPEKERQRWERLKQTRDAVSKLPAFADSIRNGTFPCEEDFAPAWREQVWFAALAAAQHELCAWCASEVLGHTGTIDHIRPKTAVTRRVREAGEEIDAPGHVRGRTMLPDPPLRPGYYKYAYDPNNLVYACERCNAWKRTLWPIGPRQGPWAAPTPDVRELELVLDPFAPGFDPLRHFCFGEDGIILARRDDERAEVTIETLGLDRETLCKQRRKRYDELVIGMASLRRALGDATVDPDDARVLPHMAASCAWSSPHAAFYRAALRFELTRRGLAWARLQEAWAGGGIAPIDEPPADSWAH